MFVEEDRSNRELHQFHMALRETAAGLRHIAEKNVLLRKRSLRQTWRPLCRGGTLLRGARFSTEIECAVDQADMAVGLREIAQHPTCAWIELLGQKTDVVAARHEPLEKSPRLRVPSLQDVVIDEPEAAHQECAFARRKTVASVFGFVPEHELAVYDQLLLDGVERALCARIHGRQEADDGKQQQTRIQLFGAVRLHEAAELRIESSIANLGMDLVGDIPPAFRFCLGDTLLCGAIEGDPCHNFGMDEVSRAAPNLPDSFVGISPDLGEIVQDHRAERVAPMNGETEFRPLVNLHVPQSGGYLSRLPP
jgi:hypothetical protein